MSHGEHKIVAIAGFGEMRDQLAMVHAVLEPGAKAYLRTPTHTEEYDQLPEDVLLYKQLPMNTPGTLLSNFPMTHEVHKALIQLQYVDEFSKLELRARELIPANGLAFVTWGGDHQLCGQLLLSKQSERVASLQRTLQGTVHDSFLLTAVESVAARLPARLCSIPAMILVIQEAWDAISGGQGLNCFGFNSIVEKLEGRWDDSDELDKLVLEEGAQLVKKSVICGSGAYSHHRVQSIAALEVILRGCPKCITVSGDVKAEVAEAMALQWFTTGRCAKSIESISVSLPNDTLWSSVTRVDDWKVALMCGRNSPIHDIFSTIREKSRRLWW